MKLPRHLTNDLWGGLAATLVALPSAIAYGVAVFGLFGPEWVGYGIRAGILGAAIAGLTTGVVGGAGRLISAPSAPAAAVLVSFAATSLAHAGTEQVGRLTVLIAATTLLTGILQAFYGLSGGGRLIKYIPYPVVAGYLSAVGVMIFLGQLPKFLGVSGPAHGAATIEVGSWRFPAIAVGIVTVAAMILAPRFTRRVPAAIVALLAGTVAYLVFGLANSALLQLQGNPLLLGPINTDEVFNVGVLDELAHALRTLTPGDFRQILISAVTLSVLLSIDTLKTCVIVDALTLSRHDSNRTLVGQGIANSLSALAGGMPGSGTMGATMVNSDSGGQTRLSSVAEGVFALLIVLVSAHWIGWIPVSALAGILLVVAFRMFDWRSVHLLRQRSTVVDFVVVLTVVATAVAANLIAAAGAGVGLAILLFIRDQIHGTVIHRKTHGDRTSSKQHRLPEEIGVLEKHGREITICELQGPLFFGTTDQLFRELEPDLTTTRFLILDLRRVQSLDYTAAHLFQQFESMLGKRNGALLFSRIPARRELREYLSAQEHMEPGRHARRFATLDDALRWTEDQIIAEHLPRHADIETKLPLAAFELTRELEDDSALNALSACMTERRVEAGSFVFRTGDPSDELYLVRKGIVRITLPLNSAGYHTVATFGPGHFFGEMAFLVRGARSADAMAQTDADLYAISRTRFDALSRAHPTLGVKVFARLARALAERLRRADTELRSFYDA